jgi:hypothetical protein
MEGVLRPLRPTSLTNQDQTVFALPAFETRVCTKAFGDVQKGDVIVEGFVSAPIKDLQGDVLELPALVQAKAAMTAPPHNLVWLDHESPYARPIENQGTPPIAKFVEAKIVKVAGLPLYGPAWL